MYISMYVRVLPLSFLERPHLLINFGITSYKLGMTIPRVCVSGQ